MSIPDLSDSFPIELFSQQIDSTDDGDSKESGNAIAIQLDLEKNPIKIEIGNKLDTFECEFSLRSILSHITSITS